MDSFLRESRRKLTTLSDETKVHVVIGNEACDLDSAVSALVYAYYLYSLSQTQADDHPNVLYIPVLNIPRQDYPLRTEVTHCLRANHITDDILLFREDVDLRTLHNNSQLVLTLVDHNVLVKSDSFLDDDIVEIVDHHSNGRHGDRQLDITLEMVGSCSTLVTEKILSDCREILDETTVTLLLSTILVDTFNLSESAKKTTPKDESMVGELQQLCSHIDRQELFEGIEKVKFDVSGLSTTDLLRKDYKSLQGSCINIGLSSITLHLKDLLERPSIETDLQSFCSDTNLHILLLVNLALVDKDTPQRQLGIYTSSCKDLKGELVRTLQESDTPQLQLSEIDNAPLSIAAYDQGNVVASRKKLMPLVQEFLEELEKDPQRVEELIGTSNSKSESDTMDISSVDLLSGLDPLEPSHGNLSSNRNNANDDDPFGLGSLSSSSDQIGNVGQSIDDPFGFGSLNTSQSSGANVGQESSTSSLLDLDPFGENVAEDSRNTPVDLDLFGGDVAKDSRNTDPEDLSNTGTPGLLDLDPFSGMNVNPEVSSSEVNLLPDLADLSDINSTPQPPSLLDLDPFGGMGDSPSSSSNLASVTSEPSATSDPTEPMATSPSSHSSIPLGGTEDLLGLDPFAGSQDTASSTNPFSLSVNPLDSTNGNHNTNIEDQNDNDLLGIDNLSSPTVAIGNTNDIFSLDNPQSSKPADNDIFNLGVSENGNSVTDETVNNRNSNDLFNLGTANDLEEENTGGNDQNVFSVSDDSNLLNRSNGKDPAGSSMDLLGIDENIKVEEGGDIFSNGETPQNIPRTPKNSVSDVGDISLSGFQKEELDKEALSERVEELHRTKSLSEADEEAEVISVNADSLSIPRDDSFSPLGGLESSETFSDEPSDSSSGESYTVNEDNGGLDQFPMTQIEEDEEEENEAIRPSEDVPEEVVAEVEEYVNNVVQMSSFLYKQEMSSLEERDASISDAENDDDDVTMATLDADDDDRKTEDDSKVENGEDKAEVEEKESVTQDETTIGEITSSEQLTKGTEKALSSEEEAVDNETVSEEVEPTEPDNTDIEIAEIPETNEDVTVSSVETDQKVAEEIGDYVDTVVQMASFAYKQKENETEVVQLVNEQTNNGASDIVNGEQVSEGVDNLETIDSNIPLFDTNEEVLRETISTEALQSEVDEAENMQAADADYQNEDVTMATVLTKEETNVCESENKGGADDVSSAVVEDKEGTIDDIQNYENANYQSEESNEDGVDDTVLVENCQRHDTKEDDDVCIDADEVKNYVESVVQRACVTHQEQVESGEQDNLDVSAQEVESLTGSSISPYVDNNGESDVISPIQSAINDEADDNLSVPEVKVTSPTVSPEEATITEAVIVPTEGAAEESAMPAAEETILPTEGSTTESAISNGADDMTTVDTNDTAEQLIDAETEDSVQDMDTSFDETLTPSPESTPSRPGTLSLSDSRGGKTKIKPVYAKPKSQAGTPGSLLSEDGSIYSVTTLDAVNMFPITPSPGSTSDNDDDLDSDRHGKEVADPPSPPKRLVSVDSTMAADIGGDWTGEAEILEKAAARQREKEANSGQRLTPKLQEHGRQLSIASAAAKQRMEGIQLPDEWQDDELSQQKLYGHEDADDEFYKQSVPRMDSIRENGHNRVESGTSTTTPNSQALSARERVDSDVKKLRGDSDMSEAGEHRGGEDSEVSEKFGSRRRHMSEDSLEDDIAYLEEEGDLEDVSDDEDDAGEGARPKKKIPAELDLDEIDGPGISVSTTTNGAAMLSPTTTEEMSWDDDGGTGQKAETIPEYSAKEELEDKKNWRRVMIAGKEHAVDMRAINPYKKVLSHGGYYGDGLNAIIVFASCYMPDKSRKDYNYVMHNLFLYVVSTLELLVAQDYMIVYFHGAAPKSKIPSLSWMRKCYKMIDRKLKKNLKGLYLVHPTTWLKTVVRLTRPFVSSKFSSKLKFIYGLEELEKLIPMDFVYVPEEVRRHDERIKRKENGRHWWGWLGYTNTLSDDEWDDTCDGSELSSIDDLDDLLFPQLPRERNKHRHGDLDFPSSPQSTTSDERVFEPEMESSDSGCSDHEDLHHEGVEGGGFMEDDIFAYSNGNVTHVNRRTPRPLFVSARRKQSPDGNRTPTNEMNG